MSARSVKYLLPLSKPWYLQVWLLNDFNVAKDMQMHKSQLTPIQIKWIRTWYSVDLCACRIDWCWSELLSVINWSINSICWNIHCVWLRCVLFWGNFSLSISLTDLWFSLHLHASHCYFIYMSSNQIAVIDSPNMLYACMAGIWVWIYRQLISPQVLLLVDWTRWYSQSFPPSPPM